MGRPRNPQRDLSLERYVENDGKISTAELAKLAGVPESRIRKWKSEDKWDEALKKKPRKRGGQKGNKNAVTHGAFAQAGFEDIPPEKAEEIRNMKTAEAMPHMMAELQALYLRKAYLEKLLAEYEAPEAGGFYTDKIVHMIVPKSMEDKQAEESTGIAAGEAEDPEAIEGQQGECFKTAMKSIIKSSPFDRAMKVEAELNKLHGRIIKQLDSIKAHEMESRRLQLEERRLELMKQKLTGEIDIDPEDEDWAEDGDGGGLP